MNRIRRVSKHLSPVACGGVGFGTTAIHGGQEPNPLTGAVTPGIELATTYAQESPGVHKGYEYSRSGNPTRTVYEKLVAELECGKHALAFASGCAATQAIVSILKSGDHIICMDDVYGGTNRLFNRVASPAMGMKISMVDLNDMAAFRRAITPNTKMIWLETPTNPMLKCVDIQKVAQVAHQHDIILVVDNTFATPFNTQPLTLGADIVVHSVTKYMNGHSDIVGGVMATNSKELRDRVWFVLNSTGGVPSPFDCYMVIRGLKTLHLRMAKHADNATAVAHFLSAHDKVEKVIYPGLPDHPDYELARKQMKTPGGMVTFLLRGGLEESRRFLSSLKLFALAESLGAVESLAEHPAIMTHASVPPAERQKLGIFDNLVRLSVGVENIQDIIADLTNALNAV